MWRFALPAFLAAIVTLSLPSAKAFGDDVTPSQPPPSAPPVAVQSPLARSSRSTKGFVMIPRVGLPICGDRSVAFKA